jgi:CHAT domain-containing protein
MLPWAHLSVPALCVALGAASLCPAAAAGPWIDDLHAGEHARDLGNIADSIAILERAVRQAPTPSQRVEGLTQLGFSLAQSGRLSDADSMLQTAYREADGEPRYAIALALGNVAFRAHDPSRAEHFYDEASAAPGDGVAAAQARLSAELNQIRLQPELERLGRLQALVPRIEAVEGAAYRARVWFGVGEIASDLVEPMRILRPEDADRLLALGYRGLLASRDLARTAGDAPLAVDADDALAQLYEAQGRPQDAWALNRTALAEAAHLSPGQAEFPLTRLDWRAARLQQRAGKQESALGSYLRAAQHLESLRQDLPIEDARGRSTYQTLQRPIFIGLLDLLLGDVDALAPAARQGRLATALGAIEFAHQAELQDYLGDRCSVESVRSEASAAAAPDVVIVYPIIIKNRLEVLVKTRAGVLHHAAPVSSERLADAILDFRGALLDSNSDDFLSGSRQLYDWLLAPFSQALDSAHVRALVIVPDGVLRLIPFAALNDGRQFLAQRYWLSTVTGLTMTERSDGVRRRPASLLAGISTPGPVIDRLLDMGFNANATLQNDKAARGLRRSLVARDAAAVPASPASSVSRGATLRSELELPGARAEIQGLASRAHSVRLLDSQFTVERFAHEVHSGEYSIVHVASHAFFGANVAESFLLAYDNVIRIDELQRLMSVNDAQQPGIDLLTLSACDTATGDDRAPLGFAGAGIKARARSVVGSLWAVSDAATQQFMELFYAGLAQHGKAQAFTLAQRSLMQAPEFAHPFYWAPFILTGDWN